jgi:hypothetical protein
MREVGEEKFSAEVVLVVFVEIVVSVSFFSPSPFRVSCLVCSRARRVSTDVFF